MRSISITMVLVAGLLAACGGGKKDPKQAGDGDGSGEGSGPPPPIAQTLLGWGQQPATGGKINLFLEVTDHTGASKSYPVGDVTVACQTATGKDDVVTALVCLKDGSGAELRAVHRNAEIIVLRRAVDPADDPEDVELSFREITRVEVPVGAAVRPATE